MLPAWRSHPSFIAMGDFKRLRVWKEAREFVVLSNNAIKKLPTHEKYLLADQWRRAAYSVPLNIAEGTAKDRKSSVGFSASRWARCTSSKRFSNS